MRYAVLLRGVNVNGVKVEMTKLKAALTAAGFKEVKTLLAGGNVLLDSSKGAATVKATCEKTLRDGFGYDAWVLVYTVDQLREIVAGYPFPREDEVQHPYVIFSHDGVSTGELGAIGGLDPALERVAPGPHHTLYWRVERGNTLDSVIGKAAAKVRYRTTTTTRNLRTVEKLAG